MKTLTIILITLFLCSQAFASEGQAPQSEQGIFSGSLGDAIWTVTAFVVLLAVLGKLAWKPLLNALKTREDHIRQEIESAETAHKKAEKMLADYEFKGMQIIKQVTDQAQEQGEKLAEKTRQEMFAIKRRTQEDIEHARIAASEQLWEEAGQIAAMLSSEVLGRTITQEDNQRLIREAITKLRQ